MLNKVNKYIIQNKLLKEGDKVLIALSGGPDSVCLLHLLYELKDILKIKLGAIHINHMLRGEEATKDEEYVSELCEKLGINLEIERIDIDYIAKNKGVSLEVAGRDERYRAFEESRKRNGYTKIAVAHNSNDQAETVLMRMMRGTGLEGLTGIKVKRDDGIIRPILCLNRDEIEKYCEEKLLNPRIDATNNERIYSRNKVRLDILPYMKENFNGDIIETLNRMTILLQKDNEFIEEYSNKCYNEYCEKVNGKIKIFNSLFTNESEAIISRVVKKVFKEVSNSYQNFEMKHIYEIINLVNRDTGKKISLTNNIIVENLYGDIILRVKEDKEEKKTVKNLNISKQNVLKEVSFNNHVIRFEVLDNNKVEFSKNNLIKLFDYDKIERDISIRYRQDGDRIVPFGMNGSKKVKDILMDLKIPREKRDFIPIVCFDNKISWIVGIKTSQEFIITKDTKKILKITFSGEGK